MVEGDSLQPTPNHVLVTNGHGHDVTVFAVSGDARIRIGRVPAGSQLRFPLPEGLEGSPMRLSTDCLVADEGHDSRLFTWAHGDAVELSIDRNLTTSDVRVR